jgi:ATP-dependent RNA helicase SUPV3L1/SUV3
MPISFSSSGERDSRARGHGVTAVLGPTNTGKTHLAIERMLAHSSGIIGLPLRLLAREVYNKVCERVGPDAVALITGEEKIKPANPRFWVSTVEAMPRDLDVAFVAVDEVQLGADLERGHVFTERMLNRRGREETLVLGAGTMRPMVERLLPGANILSRPRLSQLTFAGEKKITRQPRRTAIVAFSSDEVYAIAELIRRQRGGAAVVLGSLSPRTRNAQVALFQSGDVDYLVATDAIGMGLNLDVDHVAFASDRKFDGYQFRRLNPAEFAQIAGRAGRASRDGTFGTTGRCGPFDAELVHALESHAFEPVKVLQWRNVELDFSSLGALSASLAETPTLSGLTRAPVAEDILVLEHASRDEDVRAMATGRAAVERLWDVCQIPDYRKISPATHAELAVTLYGFLMREGRISDDWFTHQIEQADRTDGDIDTLSTRIAHIRTWTFAANRPDWLADPEHWQGVTRAIEDRLSDALHERLAERFVDRRTSVLMRRLRENTMLETEITKTGEVVVEGHTIGRLDGFRFAPDTTAGTSDAKALSAAAQKALAGEIEARAHKLAHAPDAQFVLTSDATIRWVGEPVAKVIAGDVVLRPRLRILADEQLTGAALESVQNRLDLWLRTHVERLLGPLFVLSAAEDIVGLARGIAYQIVETLGVLERSKVADDLKSLDQPSRAVLRGHGVRFGAYHVYVPVLLKPAPRSLAAQLWAIKHGGPDLKGLDDLQRLAASGRTSFAADKDIQRALYRTIGYRVCAERAVRVDILERLADLIRPALAWRPNSAGVKPAGAFEGLGFTVTQAMTSLTGSSGEDFASILRALGYRMEKRPKPPEPPPAAPESAAEATPDAAGAADAEASAEGTPSPTAEDAASFGEEAVPAPVEVVASPPADDVASPPAEAEASEPEATEPVESAAADGAAHEPAPEPPRAADVAQVVAAEAVTESAGIAAAESEAETSAAPETAEAAVAPAEAAAADGATLEATATDGSTEAAAAPAEPELVEVWRPGGRSEERRGPRRPAHRQHRDRAQPAADGAVAADGQAAAAGAEQGQPHQRRHRRGPPGEFRRGEGERREAGDHGERRSESGGERRRGERPAFGKDRQEGGNQEGRNQEGRNQEGRNQEGRQEGRQENRGEQGRREERRGRDHRDANRGQEHRRFDAKDRRDAGPRREREKQPDPNSPFAKLAALKAQLEANAKEPR